MSIASEIQRLKTSKTNIKAQVNIDVGDINEGTDFIDEETLDDYADLIENMQDAYKQYIPIHTKMIAKGNTSQNGTPTPTSPVEVKTVTGEQTITISNGTESKDYEIDLTSRNLLDYTQLATRTENGITITNNGDGTFSVNGTATADISLAINNETFVSMSGTWRMVGCPSGGSSSTYMLSAYVGYWGGGSPNIDTGNGTSITYTGNVKVRFYIKSGTTCNNLLFKPMITYDLNATYEDFSPYFTPIELCKIGTYQDYIRKGTGGYKDKWYIEKNIGKVILNGNDDVASFQAGITSGIYRFAVGVTGIDSIGIDEAGTDSQLYCNLLKSTNRDKSYAKVEGICYGMATNTSYKNFIIYTDETKTYDVATFKTWLTNKAPIVYYIKKDPSFIEITNENLIDQLDNIKLQTGENNVLVSGDLPMILDLSKYIQIAENHL